MTYKKAGGNYAETIDVKEKPGQLIEGVYLGSREVPDHGIIHSIILNGEKEEKSFWGTGSLNYRLKEVPKKAKVRITYNGMKKNVEVTLPGKKKPVKKDVHDFTVEYDDGSK